MNVTEVSRNPHLLEIPRFQAHRGGFKNYFIDFGIFLSFTPVSIPESCCFLLELGKSLGAQLNVFFCGFRWRV